jgi:8-amino-7-oxononanoate synthase
VSRALDEKLAAELAAWRARGLERTLDDGGAPHDPARDFVSNDYLGLSRDERVIEAARRALLEGGAGARAARLLGGGSKWHVAAERAAADWIGGGAPLAALLFPTGYQANLGVVGALAGRGDALCCDELVHASLVDAARLSRAHVHVFRHGDQDELAHALSRTRGARRRLILTEGVFGMDGDLAPLAAMHELCERFDAWLVVDEAHGAGVVGPRGRGACAELGLEHGAAARLAARVVTGGKALGGAGAFVVGSERLRELLLQRARSFLFTTSPPPSVAGALAKAIELAAGMDDARARVRELARRLATRLDRPAPAAAIVPLSIGSNERVVALKQRLAQAGFAVGAVRPPTVPEGGARLRLIAHATNDEHSIDSLAQAIDSALAKDFATPASSPASPVISDPRRLGARTLFVVGTDTGVGKTVASALLLAAARASGGRAVAYWKPVQTGDEDDAATVRALASASDAEILPNLHAFALPASPHAAAAAQDATIEPEGLDAALARHRAALAGGTLLVELAGGLLVPYRAGERPFTQADWLAHAAAGAHVEVVVVARSGLGTLNHTLLTLEAMRVRHVNVAALLMVGPPHRTNRETLAQLADVPRLIEVAPFEPLDAAAIARAAARPELAGLFARPAARVATP